MTRVYLDSVRTAVLGALLLPAITIICSRTLMSPEALKSPVILFVEFLVPSLVGVACYFGFSSLLRRYSDDIDDLSKEQVDFIDGIPDKYVGLGIILSAGLSLYLELAVIRWQSTIFEFFAFYKNFGLLACFAGLGLGYALAGRDRIPLILTMPLMAAQMALLIFLRHGLDGWRTSVLSVTPVTEQLNMGISVANTVQHYIAIYSFLAVVFFLTALAFVPVGQLCGRFMQRRSNLRAYGGNLLGSLLGVILLFVMSYLWTPPAVWFGVIFVVVIFFVSYGPRALLVGSTSAILVLIILSWPVSFGMEKIYSPYQLLERGKGDGGLMMLRAAGHYFQRVHNLSLSNANRTEDEALKHIADYYELAYQIHGKPTQVAIVGAGTGNDVAAALRSGVGRVDAIEIDPVIVRLGKMYHPEAPYADSRVKIVVNDARSFFRTTKEEYDMVVYGLLDSHTLLSHASNVRLDSFVYTVEGLREARARLKEDGTMSLSFCVLSNDLGRKIYLMMTEAFEGRPPVCIRAGYDASVIFLQGKNHDVEVPSDLIEELNFTDITELYADPGLRANLSTDDWPFFYMPRRVYPMSYVFMVAIILILSFLLTSSFVDLKPRFSHVAFFFLGAGFLLIETKGITEMGLVFGNTWQVIGIMIMGILTMAYLANGVVQWLEIRNPTVPFVLLILSLMIGLLVAREGGFTPTLLGRLASVAVVTVPVFFSGMVFSTLLTSSKDISGVMAVNLLGAMFGGVVEYNSMYFGFQFLYWMAVGLYVVAFFTSFSLLRKGLRVKRA